MQTIQLRLIRKTKLAVRTAGLVFEPLDGDFPYRSGQFVTLLFHHLGPKPVRRSYSLYTSPGVDVQPAIAVKAQPNGLVSKYLVERLQEGEVLEALPPAGKFVLPPFEGPRDVFLFGGGSGVTPLFALLKRVLTYEAASRVYLVLANRDDDHVIFREALNGWAERYPDRLEILHLLSSPKEGRTFPAVVTAGRGRLTNALVEDFVGRRLSFPAARAQFFLCGPSGLSLKVQQTLGFMGFSSGQIRQEQFVIVPAYRPPNETFPRSTVWLETGDGQYEIPVSPGQTILEAAEAQGVQLPYSCRSGICTTCSARCANGKAAVFTPGGRMDSEALQGQVLTCVGYPVTEEVRIKV